MLPVQCFLQTEPDGDGVDVFQWKMLVSFDPDRRVETAYDARYTRAAPRPSGTGKKWNRDAPEVNLLASVYL